MMVYPCLHSPSSFIPAPEMGFRRLTFAIPAATIVILAASKRFRKLTAVVPKVTTGFRLPTIDIPAVSFVIPAVSKPFRTLTMAVPKPTISFPKGTTGFPSICYESSGLFMAFLRHIFVKGGFAYNNISDTI